MGWGLGIPIRTERLRRVTGANDLLSLIEHQLAPPCRKAAFKAWLRTARQPEY
ncbi:hypothetical protein I5654_22195 [Hafnia paralvei]|uniref:hypothetical protein n=1 Tax=Hafnia paralvei TaxID=546367 RepID=UPI001D33C694|nr:hypothetical protein [Hafnia paralvei]